MALLRSLLGGQPKNESAGKLDAYVRHGNEGIWAGVDVSLTTALQIAAAFDCLRVIAEDMGKLPTIVYREGEDDSKDRAKDSPYWRLLHDRPNGWHSAQQFKELLTFRAAILGDAFAFKSPLGATQVRELLPMDPARTRMEQVDEWDWVYRYRHLNNEEKVYTRRDVLHLSGPQITNANGARILDLARQTFGLSLAAHRHGSVQFGNGARPASVLSYPEELSAEAVEQLREELRQYHSRENAGKTLILQKGAKWDKAQQTNQEAQFLELREAVAVEVAQWFRVPPHKIGVLGRATWGNMEGQEQQYIKDTLMAWGMRWDNAYNLQVIGTNSIRAETLYDAMLMGLTLDRYRAYEIGIRSRILKPNEARRRENLAPYEGGDDFPPVAGATPNGGDGEDESDDGSD